MSTANETAVDTLAEDYWAHYLSVNPTEAHLIGDYSRAAEFESATREAQDADIAALREFGRRAAGIDREGLDDAARR